MISPKRAIPAPNEPLSSVKIPIALIAARANAMDPCPTKTPFEILTTRGGGDSTAGAGIEYDGARLSKAEPLASGLLGKSNRHHAIEDSHDADDGRNQYRLQVR